LVAFGFIGLRSLALLSQAGTQHVIQGIQRQLGVEWTAQHAFHHGARPGSRNLLLFLDAELTVPVMQRSHVLITVGGKVFAQRAEDVGSGLFVSKTQPLAVQPMLQPQRHLSHQDPTPLAQGMQGAEMQRALRIGQGLQRVNLLFEFIDASEQTVEALLRRRQGLIRHARTDDGHVSTGATGRHHCILSE
jgi:hypothetical protein